MLRNVLLITSAAALLAWGCSDSDPETEPAGGSGGSGGDGGSVASLSIEFVDAATGAPLSGVGVAWDMEDGSRIEAVSDDDGTLPPTDVDLADVKASVAHKPGYAFQMGSGAFLRAVYDASEARGEPLQIGLAPLIAGSTPSVRLTGTAAGMESQLNRLSVSATVLGSTRYVQPGPSSGGHWWSIRVPPGEPFTLVAVEYLFEGVMQPPRGLALDFLNWGYLDSEGVTEDTHFALDVGTSLSPQTAVGSFAMPDNEAFISGARATLLVRADVGAPWGYLGGPRMIDVSSDGTTVDFEAEWVEPPGLSLVTTYQLSYRTDPQDHESAELIVDGPPQAGSFEPGFLSPAVLTTPRTGHPLHNPIRWDLPAGQTHEMTQLMLSSAIGGGGMALLGNETEVTIPVLPSTSSEAAVFADPVTLVLQIHGCSDLPGPCSAVSRDKPAQLTP